MIWYTRFAANIPALGNQRHVGSVLRLAIPSFVVRGGGVADNEL